MLRFPADALSPGQSPIIDTVGRDPRLVTKISDDPYAPRFEINGIAVRR